MTGPEMKAARQQLNLSQNEMATALKLRPDGTGSPSGRVINS